MATMWDADCYRSQPDASSFKVVALSGGPQSRRHEPANGLGGYVNGVTVALYLPVLLTPLPPAGPGSAGMYSP